VLGDVGQPKSVGAVDLEVALDQVFFGRLIDQVLLVFLRARQALDASSRMIDRISFLLTTMFCSR
jgi:hypothetical protein